MNRVRPCWRLLACLGLAVSGCTQLLPEDAVKVFPVTGTLSFNGDPMKHAVITFYAKDSKLTALGTANEQGDYDLTTYLTNDGAAEGDYTVTIYWPDENFKPPAGDPDPPLPPDRLKQEYNNAKQPKLTAKVLDEPNSIDFKLP